MTVSVSKITGYTGVVTETMKLDLKFILNGKVVIDWLLQTIVRGLGFRHQFTFFDVDFPTMEL